jgi:hypothetical protein
MFKGLAQLFLILLQARQQFSFEIGTQRLLTLSLP